jgi:hypothetical protein
MSLTSELSRATSPINLLLRKYFPRIDKVVKLAKQRLNGMTTIRPENAPPWALIGTAFDYRLRFYFPQEVSTFNTLVAASGLDVACGQPVFFPYGGDEDELEAILEDIQQEEQEGDTGFLSVKIGMMLIARFEAFIREVEPARKRLGRKSEDELLRYCIVFGMLDEFYRRGFNAGSPLLLPQPKQTVSEMLALAEDDWIEDLRNLSWGFFDEFESMLGKSAILNPVFQGSSLVGGADADLILDRCLIEIKTTINPLRDNNAIYQLLGYVLLDLEDNFKLERIGIYLSRQLTYFEWSLNELMEIASGGEKTDLAKLREEVVGVYPYSPTGRANLLLKKSEGIASPMVSK